MGKVKSDDGSDCDDKFGNEIVRNRKKKKRIKELDKIRRKVLEAKKKLREKTARRKEQSSTSFSKILNKFADRRQENDNKTQGFDTKGKRTGRKKMCNRLLPLRKAQVGIFANGSKGAEIKRAPLLLSESDRARFEGDLQKVLSDGKRKTKESKSNGLKKTVRRRLSSESSDTDNGESVENLKEKNSVKNVQCCGSKNQGAIGNKMQMSIDFDEKMRRNSNSGTETEIKEVAMRNAEIKPVKKNSEEKSTWKRSLFQDEEDQFEPCECEPIAMELRFSPRTDETKAKLKDPEKFRPPLDSLEPKADNQGYNFNYDQLGKMAATRYEKLCTMVCYDNFDTCLRELPHVDPLKSVKKFLTNFYVNSCRRKSLKNKNFFNNELTPRVASATDKFNSIENSEPINSLKENKKIHVEGGGFDVERLKRFGETINQYPKEMDDLTNRREETITKIDDREREKSMNIKILNDFLLVKKSVNKIRVKNNLPKDVETSESSSNYVKTNSLRVNNCESTKASLKSDVADADLKFCGEVLEEKVSAPTLSAIPENRQKIMIRYLRDQLSVENHKPILLPEITKLRSRSSSTENTDFRQSRRKEEPLKRNYYAADKNDEKKRQQDVELCQVEFGIDQKKEKLLTPIAGGNKSRYLGIEMNNPEAGEAEEEIRKQKLKKRSQESKIFFLEVDKKCEKHVPAILRKSRNVRMGKSLGSNFPELILKRKARNSLGESLQARKKQATENSQFFIDAKTLKTKNKVRVHSANLQPTVKKIEQNLTAENAERKNNLRSLTDCNIFEKSPSIDRLESLAAQTSGAEIFLNDEKTSKDRPLFFIQRDDSEAGGSKIGKKNLVENFSPLVFKPRIVNEESRSFLSTGYGEPKVIIIHENEIRHDRRTIGNQAGRNFLQPNYHRLVPANSGMRQIPFHPNGSRNGFAIPQTDGGHRVYESFDGIDATTDRQNPLNLEPKIVYKEQESVFHFENDSGVYFEPRMLNVVKNSRSNFHPGIDSTDGNHLQPWVSLPSFRGNSNFDRNLQNTSQLFDRRNVQALILPRNEREPYLGNLRVDPVPKFDEQIPRHRGDCPGTILSRDENSCCYKYIPDPYGCPRDGYERSQIDGSGSNQRHQPVIQPAYNLAGAYRPQELSKNYFSNGP